MNFRLIPKIILLIFILISSASASETEEKDPFKKALPDYQYQFPRDFYSHDDFRIEWWYYTGHLEDEATGRDFGYQLTFFRVALAEDNKDETASRWTLNQVYFAHFTVTDIEGERFHFFERINRSALEQAGADEKSLNVWNEDWLLKKNGPVHHLIAKEKGVGIDLRLKPSKPLVIHGEHGISQKGGTEGNASHYFSYTRMVTEGTVTLGDKMFRVKGSSWMDREFSSNQLSEDQIGWDWFSLQLDNGEEWMLYQLRLKGGGIDPFSSGTFVRKDGSHRHLKNSEFEIVPKDQWTSEHSGIEYPSRWVITVPGSKAKLKITPDVDEQELFHLRSISRSYWEGSVTVTGDVDGKQVTGKGYVELVGYGKALQEQLPE